MRKKNKRIEKLNSYLTEVAYIDIENELHNKAIRAVKWEGLPPSINTRVLEKNLISKGVCAIVEFEGDIYAMDGTAIEPFNINYEGTRVRAIGNRVNTIVKRFMNENEDKTAKGVLIFDNDLRVPFFTTIQRYAYKIWDIEASIDTNINAQKVPFALIGDDKDRLTLVSLFSDIKFNVPFIQIDPSLSLENVKPVPINTPFTADKLQQLAKAYRNEFNSKLGLNNIDVQKKEHLLVDEINANNESIDNDVASRLRCRQEGLDLCKKLWPDLFANASVDLAINTAPDVPDNNNKEDVNNE